MVIVFNMKSVAVIAQEQMKWLQWFLDCDINQMMSLFQFFAAILFNKIV